MDLRSLVPWIKEGLQKGKTHKQIYDELFLTPSQRVDMTYYLKEDEIPKDETDGLTFMPQKKIQRKIVTVKGKTYLDVTEYMVDCGG